LVKTYSMKKIYFSLLSLGIIFSVPAQTSLTQANSAPAASDTYTMYQCDSTAINPGASGAGAVWNFSAMATHSSAVFNYAATTSTNTSYPQANVAVGYVSSNQSYLNSSTGSLLYYGGNFVIPSVVATLQYSTPAIQATYPMSLNTSSSTAISGTINATQPIATTATFVGTSSVIADGTGTVNLPGSATFSNCMRVVTSQVFTFSALGGVVTATVTQMNYNYYSIGQFKAPILSISMSTANLSSSGVNTQTIVMRNKSAVNTNTTTNNAGIPFYSNESYAFAFPNPAMTEVQFEASQNASYAVICDLSGKEVAKVFFNNGKATQSVGTYAKGLYLYSVYDVSNLVIKKGRITLQ